MITTPEIRLSVRLEGPLGANEYHLREGIIEGYADIASGRFTDSVSHEEIFRNAVKELRDEGYSITQEA